MSHHDGDGAQSTHSMTADPSAHTEHSANEMPSHTSTITPPRVASPEAIQGVSGSATGPTHHHHHQHHRQHHSGEDPSGPSSSSQPSVPGASRPSQQHRKQSRKHSHRTRPSHHSHKGPVLDPNDPSLVAPGSDGRPFSDGEAEQQPLMAKRRGPGDRPPMIQYGSVYYYPLERRPTDSPYETQGRRMLLLAIIAVIVVMGILALSIASDSHPEDRWRHRYVSPIGT